MIYFKNLGHVGWLAHFWVTWVFAVVWDTGPGEVQVELKEGRGPE